MDRLPAISRPTRTTVSNRFARKASRISRSVAATSASSRVAASSPRALPISASSGTAVGAVRAVRSPVRIRLMVTCRSSIGARTAVWSRRRRRTVMAAEAASSTR